jgi:hypothetical protein
MAATGFTTSTGLTTDPTAQFAPQEAPVPEPIQPEGETRRLVGEAIQSEKVWEPSDDERSQFATLLNCGKQTKVVTIMGHKVGIESLNVDDDLRVGTFTKDYLGTEAYARAVQLATVAAGIRTVDGVPLYTPFSRDESPESIFDAKVEKLRGYHSSVIMEIYPHILNLDVEFAKLAIKLGKLKG